MAKPPPKGITTPKGFMAAGISCGVKSSRKPDLALIVADRPCTAAGMFTTNKMAAPPVGVGRRHLRRGIAQAIVCNSGNANAATDRPGVQNALLMCSLVAQHVPILQGATRLVLPSSTGVIGQPLPMDKIERGIARLASKLDRGPKASLAAARAIMTTDLVPKQAYRSIRLGKKPGTLVHLGAICKGSGMIAPHMATMLVFITTDAKISSKMLGSALRRATAVSFNRISVDQHTSPSDMVLALASGGAEHREIHQPGGDYDRFLETLTSLCQDLAHQIVKDGEGATKVFRVHVKRAKSLKDADRIGKAVVDSPLVKAAVHGGDPNWGRIVTAAGYSGASIQPRKLSLHIGPYPPVGRSQGICVYQQGEPTPMSAAASQRLKKIMAGKELVMTLDLRLGSAETQWLGCDLSAQYVAINADYTT